MYGLLVDPPGAGSTQWTAAIGAGNSYVAGSLNIGSAASAGTGVTFAVMQPISTSGTPIGIKFQAGAHTTLAAGVGIADIQYNFSRTVQFATGDINKLCFGMVLDTGVTYSFVGASNLGAGIGLAIKNLPLQGTNATFGLSGLTYLSPAQGNADIVLNILMEMPGLTNGTGATSGIGGIACYADNIALSNQTATTIDFNLLRLEAMTLTSTTNTRTITNPVTLYIEAPVAGSHVTFTNPALAAQFVGNINVTGNITSAGVAVPTILKGTATLVAGTVTISAVITANSRIVATIKDASPGAGNLTVGIAIPAASRNVGASTFAIQANVAAGTINVLDTSTLDWVVIG